MSSSSDSIPRFVRIVLGCASVWAPTARTRHVPILLTSAAVNQNDLELATSTGVLALVVESATPQNW